MSIDGLSDDEVREILKRAKTFAVVGASPKPERPSNYVSRFLIDQGYVVKPVNPGIAGSTIHDQLVYAELAAVPAPIDVVDVFRTADAVPEIVRDAIAVKKNTGASVIWMQLGVINEEAAASARAAGFTVVMDRCPKIEFARLMRN
ncbi:CoA-binding protein [Hyphomicrobium sp. 99]|uniref:CoA-binding protein n=1 Tax=Hyphomicrobium sp. 99 TaxID=1163419 RepID=UPI0005F84242|nr:CoA-binding protein [Hyphomicrobium sp. 99]